MSSPIDDGIEDLPTAFASETCVRRGLCPVTVLRDQGPEVLESHSLYFEQHGPKAKNDTQNYKHKVVLIMGLNSSAFSWGNQVAHFGAGGSDGEFTVVAFDNRGVGNSGYPKGPYTTSGMAEDLICLLDHLGWREKRELLLVGISLGGMIAQEVAWRIPKRIKGIVLAVTTPGGRIWNNLPPLEGVKCLTQLLFTPDPVKKAPIVMKMLFSKNWLQEKAEEEEGKTNHQVETEAFFRRVAITKPQQLVGHVSQMAAGLTHRVQPERLKFIARNIPKIIIVTGDDDHLVRPSNSKKIYDSMTDQPGEPDVELLQWKDTGHGIHTQRHKEFSQLIERCAFEAEQKIAEGYEDAGF